MYPACETQECELDGWPGLRPYVGDVLARSFAPVTVPRLPVRTFMTTCREHKLGELSDESLTELEARTSFSVCIPPYANTNQITAPQHGNAKSWTPASMNTSAANAKHKHLHWQLRGGIDAGCCHVEAAEEPHPASNLLRPVWAKRWEKYIGTSIRSGCLLLAGSVRQYLHCKRARALMQRTFRSSTLQSCLLLATSIRQRCPPQTRWCSDAVAPLIQPHGVQFFADLNVTFHDVLERLVAKSVSFFSHEIWLEQHFCATEAFIVHGIGSSATDPLVCLRPFAIKSREEEQTAIRCVLVLRQTMSISPWRHLSRVHPARRFWVTARTKCMTKDASLNEMSVQITRTDKQSGSHMFVAAHTGQLHCQRQHRRQKLTAQ